MHAHTRLQFYFCEDLCLYDAFPYPDSEREDIPDCSHSAPQRLCWSPCNMQTICIQQCEHRNVDAK